MMKMTKYMGLLALTLLPQSGLRADWGAENNEEQRAERDYEAHKIDQGALNAARNKFNMYERTHENEIPRHAPPAKAAPAAPTRAPGSEPEGGHAGEQSILEGGHAAASIERPPAQERIPTRTRLGESHVTNARPAATGHSTSSHSHSTANQNKNKK